MFRKKTEVLYNYYMFENYPKKERREYVMPDTDLEYQAESAFMWMEARTEDDLNRIISEVFLEICGDYGRQEFFEIALPAVKQIYGTNYRKAGLRLLEIIDEGATKKPAEVGGYFKTAVSREEIEYSQKPKEEIIQDIINKINAVILQKRTENGLEDKGIVAVIIHGSFAKMNFSLRSDLDIVYVFESEKENGRAEKKRVGINRRNFDYALDKLIRPQVESSEMFFYMSYEDVIKSLTDAGFLRTENGDQYIVVSPYPEIKVKIESLLEEGKNK